jgi:sugar lactone lactonase YvrE
MTGSEAFSTGLVFPECPRWHDEQLWSSDMWGHTVYRYGADGSRDAVVVIDDEPGGIGWLPDGRMLVVSMERRLLLRVEPNGPVVHADLAEFAPSSCNDLIVSGDGTAYVSQFGFDLWSGTSAPAPSPVIRVTSDGHASVGADDLMCPNGMALSPDGGTLLVAEAAASRIARFEVGSDGRLTNGDVFAQITPADGLRFAPPDGICLDAEGAVWMAEPMGKRVLRVRAGGEIVEEIAFDFHPTAVVLGGADRRTLYVCLAPHIDHGAPRDNPSARLDAVRVDVPGAGRP